MRSNAKNLFAIISTIRALEAGAKPTSPKKNFARGERQRIRREPGSSLSVSFAGATALKPQLQPLRGVFQ